jgi:hypothetical protein
LSEQIPSEILNLSRLENLLASTLNYFYRCRSLAFDKLMCGDWNDLGSIASADGRRDRRVRFRSRSVSKSRAPLSHSKKTGIRGKRTNAILILW